MCHVLEVAMLRFKAHGPVRHQRPIPALSMRKARVEVMHNKVGILIVISYTDGSQHLLKYQPWHMDHAVHFWSDGNCRVKLLKGNMMITDETF